MTRKGLTGFSLVLQGMFFMAHQPTSQNHVGSGPLVVGSVVFGRVWQLILRSNNFDPPIVSLRGATESTPKIDP